MKKTEDAPCVSRRNLVQGAVLAGAGTLILAVAGDGFALAKGSADAPLNETEESAESTQYGFLVRTDDCIDCKKCVEACRAHNGTPDFIEPRRKVVAFVSDYGKTAHASLSCMHCESPSCMQVCPARAISKRTDGIVVVDKDRCIGCKYCFQACPFGVPHYGAEGMDKCDCCLEAGIEPGKEPYCAQACMFGGLEFGRLEDLAAMTHGTAHQVEAATKPALLML